MNTYTSIIKLIFGKALVSLSQVQAWQGNKLHKPERLAVEHSVEFIAFTKTAERLEPSYNSTKAPGVQQICM